MEVRRSVIDADYIDREQLDELQLIRLKALLDRAYRKSDFHRERFRTVGFEPGDLRSVADLAQLPVMTKEDIRENVDRIRVSDIPESSLTERFTGGSTGIPVRVLSDPNTAIELTAMFVRTTARWGVRPGDRIAHIWGLNRLNEHQNYAEQGWWQRYKTNFVLLDAFELTTDRMVGFTELLRGFKPALLIGYVSAVTAFARFLSENGGAGFSPAAIWLTSEPTHAPQARLIEDVFNAPVYDQYGSVEVFHCAAECDQRAGLHIDADYRVIEIADHGGVVKPLGQTGEVLVTDLLNTAFPLIRYRNEDVASMLETPCSCGRAMPVMSHVEGRIYDVFTLSDGSMVYGHRFTTFFYQHWNEVKSFQVHQISQDVANVYVVPALQGGQDELGIKILTAFTEFTRNLMKFNIEWKDDIPQESSGKYRFVKSDVTHSDERGVDRNVRG
jgi:phenylacetate-CoA ligase